MIKDEMEVIDLDDKGGFVLHKMWKLGRDRVISVHKRMECEGDV